MRKRWLVFLVGVGTLLASLVGARPVQAQENVPVLIVGGLTEPAADLSLLRDRLQDAGFTVFTMALPGPIPGIQDIAQSAQAVATEARAVLARTGASRLDVVGHSEGGLALRYYIENLGGGAQVRRYVSLGTPQHGTEVANLVATFPILGTLVGAACTACAEMAVGSAFLDALNRPTDVPPGPIGYTALGTTHDELVVPAPQASFLHDGGTNASVQQFCPLDPVMHVGLLFDRPTAGLVVSALRGGPLTTTC
ncbi:MAG TPA: lipase [Candidatus Dormibacteraeota bacterium]|jgi:triacylglycerol lipase|nr:lipase [Candidatus Dormibacteraeota bacterium]